MDKKQIEEDEKKFKQQLLKFLNGRKINDSVFEEIIKNIRNEIESMIDSEIVVDQITTNSEISSIEKNLEKAVKNSSDCGAMFLFFAEDGFRLNDGLKKRTCFWEIQRDGVSGKTTVAQVKGPDSFQILLRDFPSRELFKKYHELICQKLLKSLNSQKSQSNGKYCITKECIRFNDLYNLYL